MTSTTAMRPTLAQGLAALVAMLALLIAVAVVAVVALDNLGSIIAASLGLGVAVVGCWYSLSRQGVVRLVALFLIVVGVGVVIATLIVDDAELWPWVIVATASAVSVGAAGYALRSTRRAHSAAVDAGAEPPPAPAMRCC